MQTYFPDSPQAAARILAINLLADGHLSGAERLALEQMRGLEQLEISPEVLQTVLTIFCNDTLAASPLGWTGSGQIDPATLRQLLTEVRSPALQARLIFLCEALAQADGHIADSEADLLRSMTKAWPGLVEATGWEEHRRVRADGAVILQQGSHTAPIPTALSPGIVG